jgi:ribonuclease VapC
LIFIDTSAIVAILVDEDDAPVYYDALRRARNKCTGAHVRLESVIDIARILRVDTEKAEALYEGLLERADIKIIAITDEVSRTAVQAFARFGKGRGHPAQLNFGDCLSYACAREHDAAILFKGRDFARTDLRIA